MDRQDEIEAEAVGWAISLSRGGRAEEWEAFTRWLERDPRHAAAYAEAELAVDGLDRLEPAAREPIAQPEPRRSVFPRRVVLIGGMAAAAVAVAGISLTRPGEPTLYAVETGNGERRRVELADGSYIDLNGASRILLDRAHPRRAELERGEALFTVEHDDSNPFEVTAGEALIRDLGTVFNVVRTEGRIEVGVVAGAVSYAQRGRRVDLRPGMALRVTGDASAEIMRAEPAALRGWRDGRLSYSSAPIGHVAADLSRNLGVRIEAAPEVAARRFTGVIQLDQAPDSVQRIALLMGVAARQRDGGWVLMPGQSETR
jgi:transmembrane sensor